MMLGREIGVGQAIAAEISHLERRVSQDPRSKSFVRLAHLYREKGETDRSLETCRRGLAANPEYLTGRLLFAQTLHQTGQSDLARAHLNQVRERMTGHPLVEQLVEEITGRPYSESERVRTEAVPENYGGLDLDDLMKSLPSPEPSEGPDAVLDGAAVKPTSRSAVTPRREARLDEALFATPSMVELLWRQGLFQESLDLAERILAKKGISTLTRARLEELRRLAGERLKQSAQKAPSESTRETGEDDAQASQETREKLERWLNQVRSLQKIRPTGT